jgi:hypothetical protein
LISSNWPAEVEEAATPEQALAAFTTRRLDVVSLDISLGLRVASICSGPSKRPPRGRQCWW